MAVDNKEFIELFKKSGLKQIGLARQLKVSKTIIHLWCNGKKKAPDWSVAYLRMYVATKSAAQINETV